MEDRIRLEELYGRNVFTLSKMKERLPKSVYRRGAFQSRRGRCRQGDERLGDGKRRDALHALVSASYRNHS